MQEVIILVGIVVLLAVIGAIEILVHRRHVNAIPVRIHVNGTRGKSSVTRLIAAGLRAGGKVTCAKTTGTLARMILPDGREYPVFRPARANVIEQLRIFRTAHAYNSEVLVIECMALQPYLQVLSEMKLVRATHGVITNARADHLDVMGPEEEDVARALAGMVPKGQVLYTAEQRHLDIIQQATQDRKSELIATNEKDVAAITEDDLAGFSYVEHAENVALALKICADVGVDRETALRGMWEASPDPGVMAAHEIQFFGRQIFFVNGFAANDPESTERIWQMALDRYPNVQKRIAIFNCRADRPDRSQQLARACVDWPAADHYMLIGTGTYIFARASTRAGLDSRKLYFAEDRREDEIFEAVVGLVGKSALVMGMGNIGGQGLDLAQYFSNRSVLKESA